MVAVQTRQLTTRSLAVGLLQHRARLTDLSVDDLTRRANDRIGMLATDNSRLVLANRVLSAENDRLRGRTWAGKLWRKVEPPLAVLGAFTLIVLIL